jgi:hypothetical protein
MKKLLYTFLAVSIIFSACEKEEKSNNSSNNNISVSNQNIVGVWDINSLVYDSINMVNVPGFNSASFIINSNNTFSQNVIFNGDLDIDYGNWDLSGAELTLIYDNSPEIRWSINSFNGSTASLTLVEYLDPGNYDPLPTSGSATIVKQ